MSAGHAPTCRLNSPLALDREAGCSCSYKPIEYPTANPFKDLVTTSPPTVVAKIPNIRDIAARLRTLADTIDLDDLENAGPSTAIVVMVTANGSIDVRAFGVCHDKLHAAGVLAAGVNKLVQR